jgi:hypothetical protein
LATLDSCKSITNYFFLLLFSSFFESSLSSESKFNVGKYEKKLIEFVSGVCSFLFREKARKRKKIDQLEYG